MTLEQQARTIQTKIGEVQGKCYQILKLCYMVLREETVNGDIFNLSAQDKEKIIQHYQTLKSQLQSLVEELP